MPAATVLSWWRGHPSGWWNPLDYNLASICVPIATHVPHAAGLAWGKKLRGEQTVAIALLRRRRDLGGRVPRGRELRRGDARRRSILFCNNNQWAISTPLSAQTAAPTLADKAIGYGMPGVRVDGGDVLAVYEATREAVARARAGDGPTFIEAVTYRAAPHATADDPTRLHRSRARRGGEAERVPRPLRAVPRTARGCSTTRRRGGAAPRRPS